MMNHKSYNVTQNDIMEAIKIFLDKSEAAKNDNNEEEDDGKRKYNRLGYGWYRKFLQRNPALQENKQDPVKIKCTKEQVSFFVSVWLRK